MQTKKKGSEFTRLQFVCLGVISFHLFYSLPELATESTIMFFQITIYVFQFL